ncbi:MAG TPA: DUF2914 domain-containing protein [Vicinamibacterales bacterium]|jgi:hypothetical protein
MPETRNVSHMLAEAERAARAGDLASAEELLREIAQVQEFELGPLHPDLANTLNNLAVVAEKRGRLDDAETCYRRAVEIAVASRPADDPMVVASRQNLEDFCRAQGRPFEIPAVVETAAAHAAVVKPAASEVALQAAPPAVLASPTPPAAKEQPPAISGKPSRAPVAIGVGIAALAIVVFLIARPRSPREESIAAPAAVSQPVPAAEPARPSAEAARPPADTRAPVDPKPVPKADRALAPATAITLATVQLCRTFSASDWRCVAAGDSVPPGTVVLYTRVRSPRDAVIVHRWYRGDALRKTAQLKVGANANEGYRTFSREVVDPGEWRVEVRDGADALLHEQRFAVK